MARLLIVKRDEEMLVSPNNRMTYVRVGFFLTPTVARSDKTSSGALPGHPPLPTGFPRLSDLHHLPVDFPGWKSPPTDWQEWTSRMLFLHHNTWRNAEISEAVLSSCYLIVPCHALVAGFVEKWCPQTNSFIFPWGEATITLKDVAVLGGYSVLGEPVFTLAKGDPMKGAMEQLKSARKQLNGSRANKVLQKNWKDMFFNKGSEIEHEAFLAMWLSRFVFPKPSQSDTVDDRVSHLAVLLARGTRIALAPAVLASLYASLTEMKEYLEKGDFSKMLHVSVPFQILEVWIWERFSALRPKPLVTEIHLGQSWFTRWGEVRFKAPSDIRLAIDNAMEGFIYSPYYRLVASRVYKDEPRVVSIGSDQLDDEETMLIRFVRCSKLVGIKGCIQQYLPHRVAMQLGYDLDIPDSMDLVARTDVTSVVAWEDYSRVIGDRHLYIISRLHEASVSTRYSSWWNINEASSSQAGFLQVPLLRYTKEEAAGSSQVEPYLPLGLPQKIKEEPISC